MIGNNKQLLAFVLLYWISIAFYNFFGLSVAKKLTAVHRTFIDAVRTIFVCFLFTCSCIFYYFSLYVILPNSRFGVWSLFYTMPLITELASSGRNIHTCN